MATTSMPSIEMGFEMRTAVKMHFWSSTALASFFIAVGITGNILSIVVWNRKQMRSSTGTYLIGQAVADTGLLVFFLLTDSVPMVFPVVTADHSYAVFYCYVGFPLFFWFILTSIWITVSVTVDRYILVCWISNAKRMCSKKRAVVTMVIIAVFCLVVDGPHFFTFRPSTVQEFNVTAKGYIETDYGAGFGSRMYEFWVHCMFMVLGPWVIIFVLNILIILKVGKANRKVAGNQTKTVSYRRKKSEAQMTHLLLTVTFTFLVLLAFQCITQCFFMLQKGNKHIVSEAFSIAKLGVVINSSVNFFLYCLSGKKFRRELMVVLTSCTPTALVYRKQTLTTESSNISSLVDSYRTSSFSAVGSFKEMPTVACTINTMDYKGTTKDKIPIPDDNFFTHL